MNDLKVIYTPGGEKELRVLNDDIKKQIEESLVKKKYAVGDSCVEITAYDIENLRRKINIKSADERETSFGVYMYIVGMIIILTVFIISTFLFFKTFSLDHDLNNTLYLLFVMLLSSGLFNLSIYLRNRLSRTKRAYITTDEIDTLETAIAVADTFLLMEKAGNSLKSDIYIVSKERITLIPQHYYKIFFLST
jgi:hypothetical protein